MHIDGASCVGAQGTLTSSFKYQHSNLRKTLPQASLQLFLYTTPAGTSQQQLAPYNARDTCVAVCRRPLSKGRRHRREFALLPSVGRYALHLRDVVQLVVHPLARGQLQPRTSEAFSQVCSRKHLSLRLPAMRGLLLLCRLNEANRTRSGPYGSAGSRSLLCTCTAACAFASASLMPGGCFWSGHGPAQALYF